MYINFKQQNLRKSIEKGFAIIQPTQPMHTFVEKQYI